MAKEVRILIIHGWSDCSDSFAGIKKYLMDNNMGRTETIYYADYESREDNMTYDDVIEGLNDALVKKQLVKNNGESEYQLKIIVHSTGGLVVRHWLWRYYHYTNRLDICPVTNLVMLAPANFGSPLAQMGKSFLGELVKGRWKVGDFLEVGRKLLDGLELGSPFQWDLAHRDLLIRENYYNPNKIKTTVLVGNLDYTGARGWFCKPGTDGTVVIAGTNLNTVKLRLKFARPKNEYDVYMPHEWDQNMCMSDIAFGVLKGYDHGTIVEQVAKGSASPESVNQVLLRALTDKKEDFLQLQKDLEVYTANSYTGTKKQRYQQFLVHAIDNQEEPVNDFTLEFSVYKKEGITGSTISNEKLMEKYSSVINEMITKETHSFSKDSSYRRLLINYDELNAYLDKLASDPKLADGYLVTLKIFVPKIDKGISYDIDNLQNILIYDSTHTNPNIPRFFYVNTTTLIELHVDRNNTYVSVQTEPRKH